MSPTPLPASKARRVLGAFYVVHFAHLGIVVPFLGPWLEERGLGSFGIGAVMALLALFNVLAPWSWGHWADRSGRRRALGVVAAALAGLALALAVLSGGLAALLLSVALYGFSRSALLPYVEATSLEQASVGAFDYGPVRLWGSLSFMAASAIFGFVATRLSIDGALAVAAGLLVAGAVVVSRFPPPFAGALDEEHHGVPHFRGAALLRLFGGCALMQASHGAYYAFYSIRLEHLGYDETTIGALWAFAVICEVLLLLRLDRIVRHLGHLRVMQAALLIAAVRWLAIGWSTELAPLVLAQTLHSVTYAAFHVASIRVVFRAFGEARARGQTMFSGMTYGVGMLVGGLAAGLMADAIGLDRLFTLFSLVALAGWATLFGLKQR